MRRKANWLVAACACAVVLSCSEGQQVRAPIRGCADSAPLVDLKTTHGIVLLVAAADIVAGADSICDAVLPEFWQTYEPEQMTDRVTADTLELALEWVCGRVLSLPTPEQDLTIAKLQAWCDANRWINEQSTLEAVARAVAFVPEVEDLLADEIAARKIPKDWIGDSLASAEHTQLHYELTRRLASMPEERRDAVMTALQFEIGKYSEE